MAKVLIIGGHGKVALLAAPLLAEAGHEVTSVFRNPEHEPEVAATGASPVVADVEKLDTAALTELLRGQDAVVWSAGAGGGNPDRTWAVDRDAAIRSMDAAVQAGVRRYVMVSYAGARRDHGVPEDDAFFPYAESKALADEHLRGTGLEWTILGPSGLTLEEPTGRITTGVGHGQVSRANVARVIVEVLHNPASAGAKIDFDDGHTLVAEAVADASLD